MLNSDPYNPVSTYRVQFSAEFRFADLQKQLAYLKELGIRTIYASPIFEAVPGSGHGYDIINPLALNPEIGTYEEFVALREDAARLKIGWIQDIVPNHMAFSTSNPWIMDVLKNGKKSAFSSYFDIDWNHPLPELKGKLLLPFFGKETDDLIRDKELKIIRSDNSLHLNYFDTNYPLSVESIDLIFKRFGEIIGLEKGGSLKEESVFKDAAKVFVENYGEKNVDKFLGKINEDGAFMKEIIQLQHYLPAYWKTTNKVINYRRFFTINDMIAIKMEDEEIFHEYHRLISLFSKKNYFQGVRVDHVDGLYKPAEYLLRLRQMLGEDKYIIVEKILEQDEQLPALWPVQGTTGYDFSTAINNLFTNSKNEAHFSRIYDTWDTERPSFEELSYTMKSFIIHERMEGDLNNLARHAAQLFPPNLKDSDFEKLADAIGEFLVDCPVYKIYRPEIIWDTDQKDFLQTIFQVAIERRPELASQLNFLEDIFTDETDEFKYAFYLRCMQFSGALMAKGLEDTVYYSYSRFVGHNEVGDSPGFFGIDKKSFHQKMIKRSKVSPLNMNASSTHDSKRGEDARARLAVITDMPLVWEEVVFNWREINKKYKSAAPSVPSLNDEYFIYQTLAASFPFNLKGGKESVSADILNAYLERVSGYILKSVREAKEITSWADPDEEYEKGVQEFINKIFEDGAFTDSLKDFLNLISDYGIINSLSQLLLKITCPGIPDFYRGSESWNFSLTDPDNRREVDFNFLSGQLKKLKDNESLIYKDLWAERENGLIKLWLTRILLQERTKNEGFFRDAEYIPLEISGEFKDFLMAFLRKSDGKTYLVAVPLHLAELDGNKKYSEEVYDWSETYIKLPPNSPELWKDVLGGEEFKSSEQFNVGKLFMNQTLSFLKGVYPKTERKAGVLLHISSLPGKFGIGDMGREAFHFIDFLKRTKQTYWQILPLSYTDSGSGFSPYSSLSAFAGNIMFISPEILLENDLILKSTLDNELASIGKIENFDDALTFKERILNLAWEEFKRDIDNPLKNDFRDFTCNEDYWLDDFSLFLLFKKMYVRKCWVHWPDDVKKRDEKMLEEHRKEYADELNSYKFFQFLFMRQWDLLKIYAHDKGILLFGDAPIYISYDSADVWSNPGLFRLNPDLSMESVAGVPPDYFNAKGQFWNMPLYRWDLMHKNGYKWWISRLKKNLELYDLVRIDHFRAFSKFWEIPGEEKTAVNGKWVEGPGEAFFSVIREHFPLMPFVAEDLGNIDKAVYKLRDEFGLPGMHVLQFAFGDNMPESVHIPHNHKSSNISYTGTHDNNTTQGWLKKEVDKKSLERWEKYIGKPIKIKEAHLEIIRMAYASPTWLTIIPLQDWLGLDEKARMNIPATSNGNWQWRLQSLDIPEETEKIMIEYAHLYARS